MDLIKREKVFEHIKAVCLEGDGGALITSEDFLKMAIKGIPSADKQGEWIHDYHFGLALPEHKCSVCGEWEYSDTESNYCPNCGAKMSR